MHRIFRHRVALGCAIVVAAATLAPAPVAEDRDPLSPPPLERYVRWGPFRVLPGFVVQDVGYDSNVFNAPEGEGDYRATAAPSIEALVLFGNRAFLTIDEEVRYTAYADNSDLNYWDQVGDARLTVPFGRIGAYVDVEYDRIRESPLDADDVRPVRELFRLESGIIARLGWRTTVEIGRSVGDRTNSDDDFRRTDISIGEQLDRVETEWRLRARYRAFGRTVLTLDALDGSIEFDTPNIDGRPGFERDADERRILPGIELGEGGRLSGTIRVGHVELDARGDAIRDYEGVVGDAEVTFRPLGRLTARLAAERRVDFSVFSGNNYFTYDGAEVSGLYWLSAFLGGEAGVETGRLEVPGARRRDDLGRYWVGGRFRLPAALAGTDVEYRVRLGRSDRSSTDPRFDRDRTFVNVSASFGF